MKEPKIELLNEIRDWAENAAIKTSIKNLLLNELDLRIEGRSPTDEGVIRELEELKSEFPELARFIERLQEAPEEKQEDNMPKAPLEEIEQETLETDTLFANEKLEESIPETVGISNPEKSKGVIMVATDKLEPHPLVKDLFPIDEEVFKGIVESMREGGFQKSTPILAVPSEEPGKYLVYDGLRRLKAAKENGFVEVPVSVNSFESDASLLDEVVKIQSLRRNNSDTVLLRCVEFFAGRHCPEVEDGEGRTHEVIARKIGKGATTVKHALAVIKDKELRDSVHSGKRSINAAYKKLRAEKSPVSEEQNTSASAPATEGPREVAPSSQPEQMELPGVSQPYAETKVSKGTEEEPAVVPAEVLEEKLPEAFKVPRKLLDTLLSAYPKDVASLAMLCEKDAKLLEYLRCFAEQKPVEKSTLSA